MNEKLREAFLTWRDSDVRYTPEWQADAHKGWEQACCMLYAAARGEIPGFQLVTVELSEKNKRAVFLALANADDEQRLWNDLLAASKEEFK